MSDSTSAETDANGTTVPEAPVESTPAAQPPVPVQYAPAPVAAVVTRRHPRTWVMVVAAVAAALLFMSIGAGLALGIARRAAMAGLRRGVIMSAPGRMGGGYGRGGMGGYGRGGNRGTGRRNGAGPGDKSTEGSSSIETTPGLNY
jgi:hypothetical protein